MTPRGIVYSILLWTASLFVVFVLLAGCTPAPQAQGQLPLASPYDQRWEFVPMSGGPGIFTACHKGTRLYVLDSYLNREHEFHGSSPKSLAAVYVGSCR